jgi:hypothetical protein
MGLLGAGAVAAAVPLPLPTAHTETTIEVGDICIHRDSMLYNVRTGELSVVTDIDWNEGKDGMFVATKKISAKGGKDGLRIIT